MSNKFAESYGNHWVHNAYQNDAGTYEGGETKSNEQNIVLFTEFVKREAERRAEQEHWQKGGGRDRWLKKVDDRKKEENQVSLVFLVVFITLLISVVLTIS